MNKPLLQSPRWLNSTKPVGRDSYRIDRYILKDECPVPCDNLEIWALWMHSLHRLIGDTTFFDAAGDQVRVCTAFLGVDVSFGVDSPVLYETTVLGGVRDRQIYRYCTHEEAREGHALIVDRVRLRDSEATDPPGLRAAAELAYRTIKRASLSAIKKLIERSTNKG